MIYKFYKPIPALSEIVEHYWYSKIETKEVLVSNHPTPLLQGLAFNFNKHVEYHEYHKERIQLYKKAYFFGQPTCGRTIISDEKGVDILGVKFKPLGIVKLTGINMEHMADNVISADDIWSNELESLSDEMQSVSSVEGSISVLENFLFRKYVQRKLHIRMKTIEQALLLIESSKGVINIRDLQYKSNTSRKTLERAFMNHLGVNPKLYSRIVRFNAAKKQIDKSFKNQNFYELAYDLDYCDGAHFSAEFKRFSNMTPTEYLQNLQLKTIPRI